MDAGKHRVLDMVRDMDEGLMVHLLKTAIEKGLRGIPADLTIEPLGRFEQSFLRYCRSDIFTKRGTN